MIDKDEVYKALYEFVVVMKEKLDENIAKGKTGWRSMETEWLFMRLQGEIGEMYAELMAARPDPEKVARECADVANFAMFIADKVKGHPDGGDGDNRTDDIGDTTGKAASQTQGDV